MNRMDLATRYQALIRQKFPVLVVPDFESPDELRFLVLFMPDGMLSDWRAFQMNMGPSIEKSGLPAATLIALTPSEVREEYPPLAGYEKFVIAVPAKPSILNFVRALFGGKRAAI